MKSSFMKAASGLLIVLLTVGVIATPVGAAEDCLDGCVEEPGQQPPEIVRPDPAMDRPDSTPEDRPDASPDGIPGASPNDLPEESFLTRASNGDLEAIPADDLPEESFLTRASNGDLEAYSTAKAKIDDLERYA